ncbi:MAG: tetratricopeptide repeat protein [Planctomycetes bacterium]|nr:tetratricopeptide repeat protein [Planctomycetota bacterium]
MSDGLSARRRAQAANDLHRYEEALREAGAAVAAEPSHPESHCLLVVALSGLQRFREALAAAETGLGHAPDEPALHRLRSLMLRNLKRPQEALAAADEAVRLEPEAASAFYVRGLALVDLKRRDDARAAFAEAVRLNPHDADYRRLLGDQFLAADPRAAEAHYRGSLELDPNDAVTLNNLGVALERQKRAFEAVAAYKAAVIVDPTMETAKNNVHSAVGGLLRAGGGGLFLLYVAVRVGAAAGRMAGGALLAIGILVLALIYWLYRRKRERLRVEANRAELERLDPQVFQIYQRLEAEKKWRWRSGTARGGLHRTTTVAIPEWRRSPRPRYLDRLQFRFQSLSQEAGLRPQPGTTTLIAAPGRRTVRGAKDHRSAIRLVCSSAFRGCRNSRRPGHPGADTGVRPIGANLENRPILGGFRYFKGTYPLFIRLGAQKPPWLRRKQG